MLDGIYKAINNVMMPDYGRHTESFPLSPDFKRATLKFSFYDQKDPRNSLHKDEVNKMSEEIILDFILQFISQDFSGKLL